MALSSFCGLLTLQVGSAILAVIFFLTAAYVTCVNAFNFEDDSFNSFPIPLILAVVFAVLLILAGILMFLSAYKENRKLCIVSVVIIVLILAYWLILSCFSFANRPDDLRRICIAERCPESFWLVNLSYRGDWKSKEEHTNKSAEEISAAINILRAADTLTMLNNQKNEKSEIPTLSVQFPKKQGIHEGKSQSLQDHETEAEKDEQTDSEAEDDTTTTRYEFGLPMIGAIILFIANFLFFLFTILILWSYAQELKWADEYGRDSNES